ncbi:MAG: 50S ribosomal protein L17 [Pseudomonadota bacterium]
MRHKVDGRKFGRGGSHRLAMFRNLVSNLVLHEKIVTTDAKAKELRRVAEKLVTKAKKAGTAPGKKLTKNQRQVKLAAFREIKKWLCAEVFDDKGLGVNLAAKLMDEIAPRYVATKGGYTRILKIGNRRGDNAPLSVIEFVPTAVEVKKPEEEKKKKRKGIFSGKSKKETI